MALKATVYKAEVQISDMDRHYYATHALTLACHPSETEERLMVRLLAFVLHADETLSFTKGLSTEDEPDIWKKDLTGNIDTWIKLGQPEEKNIRKACGRAKDVYIYCYSGNVASVWWEKNRERLDRCDNLRVRNIPSATSKNLAALAQRNMKLQCMIQDGTAYVSDEATSVEVNIETWKD